MAVGQGGIIGISSRLAVFNCQNAVHRNAAATSIHKGPIPKNYNSLLLRLHCAYFDCLVSTDRVVEVSITTTACPNVENGFSRCWQWISEPK